MSIPRLISRPWAKGNDDCRNAPPGGGGAGREHPLQGRTGISPGMHLKNRPVSQVQPGQDQQLPPRLQAVQPFQKGRKNLDLRFGSVLESLSRAVLPFFQGRMNLSYGLHPHVIAFHIPDLLRHPKKTLSGMICPAGSSPFYSTFLGQLTSNSSPSFYSKYRFRQALP